MTTKSLGKISRQALLISPIVIALVSFFAVLHWLKPRNAAFVLVLSAVFAIFVMGYSNFIARRVQRTLDEVQIASQGFASFRAYVWGAGTTVLLLGLNFGLMLVVLMQFVFMIVASAIWQRRMGGLPEQS
jgi:hypothetical protein